MKKQVLLGVSAAALTVLGFAFYDSCNPHTLQNSQPTIKKEAQPNEPLRSRLQEPVQRSTVENRASLELMLNDAVLGEEKQVNLLRKTPNGGFLAESIHGTSTNSLQIEDLRLGMYEAVVRADSGFGTGKFEIVEGKNDASITLLPWEIITASVTNEKTGAPINNALVNIRNLWYTQLKTEARSIQGTANLRVAPLPPKRITAGINPVYDISITHEGFTEFQEFMVAKDGRLNIGLTPQEIFKFRVRGFSGETVNPTFELYEGNGGAKIDWQIAEHEGIYEIRGLPNEDRGSGMVGSSSYNLKVQTATYPEQVISFSSHTPTKPLEYRLAKGIVVSGNFIRSDNSLVPGTAYELFFRDAGLVSSHPTKEVGSGFFYQNLGPGRYILKHKKEGFVSGTTYFDINSRTEGFHKDIILKPSKKL